MQSRVTDVGLIAKTVGQAALADRVTFLAASIAFYAFISIFPMLLVVLVVGSIVGGEAFANAVVDAVQGLLTPENQQLVEDALVEGTGRSGAGVVGVIALLWAGLKVFRGLDIAFSQVYGTGGDESFLTNLVNAGTVLLSIGVGIAVLLLVQTFVRQVPTPPLVGGLSVVLVFVALVVVFFPMYYVFPSTDLSIREVLPGAMFAGVGWTVLSELFGLYAANADTFALFGLVGAVLLLLTWFYFGAIILLVGATLNAVLAGRYKEDSGEGPGDRGPIGPDDETYREIRKEERAIGSDRETGRTGAMRDDSQDGSNDGMQERDESRVDGMRDSRSTANGGSGREAAVESEAGTVEDTVTDAETDVTDAETDVTDAETDADADVADVEATADEEVGFEWADEPVGDEPAGDEPVEDEPTIAELERQLHDLRGELSRFELAVEERTVKKPALESELKRYVRRQMRRNRARGWGPYIVLLYGTGMTLGAFYFLAGGWAILAMFVVWLSTLGLYVVMVAVGAGMNLLGIPGRVRDAVNERRS